MNLLVGTYIDDNPARMPELLICLRKNIENPHVHAVHILLEDTKERFKLMTAEHTKLLADAKVVKVECYRRLNYAERLEYTNKLLTITPDIPVAIINSDVFFDQTIALLTPAYLSGKFVCLSRRNLRKDGKLVADKFPAWAQDAWIYSKPVTIPPKLNFGLGRSGCDNRLAAEMRAIGMKVVNPSLSVALFHVHSSMVRHSAPRVGHPHLRLVPHTLAES